jgi:hypothetical protein
VQAKDLGEKWDNATGWGRMLEAGVDWLQTDDPAGVRFAEVRRRIPDFPVKISYHRGANRYAPENTIPALEKAAALGADYIEFDIRPTKDGSTMARSTAPRAVRARFETQPLQRSRSSLREPGLAVHSPRRACRSSPTP